MLNIEYDNKDYNSSETILIINCLLNAALIPVAILGNALVLIAIIRTPSIRSTSMLMLCSLAVSDLLVGIMVQPFYIAHHLTNETLLYLLEGTIGHSVWSFAFNNNGNHCGPLHRSSLPPALCNTGHQTPRQTHFSINMGFQLRLIGFLLLEQACLSCSVRSHNCHLFHSFHILLPQNLSNSPSSSGRNRHSATRGAKFQCWKPTHTHRALPKERYEYFCILHRFIYMLLSNVYFFVPSWTSVHELAPRMEFLCHFSVQQLRN